MDRSWITSSWEAALMTVVTAAGVYAAVILLTRAGGLRSFSKMSSFDFAVTVAIGSMIASTVLTRDPPLLRSAVGLGALYALQLGLARLRVAWNPVRRIVDNQPVLLMEHGQFHDAALTAVRVTRADIVAKLREANVLRLRDARAVVMESTGDISVLHTSDADPMEVEDALLDGVRRIEPRR